MKDSAREILDKINLIILSSTKRNRACAERFISLANKRLHKEKDDVWSIIGASVALRVKWEAKFGIFTPRSKPIRG